MCIPVTSPSRTTEAQSHITRHHHKALPCLLPTSLHKHRLTWASRGSSSLSPCQIPPYFRLSPPTPPPRIQAPQGSTTSLTPAPRAQCQFHQLQLHACIETALAQSASALPLPRCSLRNLQPLPLDLFPPCRRASSCEVAHDLKGHVHGYKCYLNPSMESCP